MRSSERSKGAAFNCSVTCAWSTWFTTLSNRLAIPSSPRKSWCTTSPSTVNLVLGHPLQPPVGFVDQLNHYQEGDGPSYCYAILILEFTPSYRTLLPGPSVCVKDYGFATANSSLVSSLSWFG